MANTFTQQAEDSGVLDGRFGGGIDRKRVVEFLNGVDDVYSQQVGDRDKRIDELSELVAKHTEELGKRDNENAEANRVIQELKATSQEKDNTISDLQEELKATSQEKDNTISDLQEKIAAYEEGQKVAEWGTSSITEASTAIQNLRDENKSLRERLEHLEGTDPKAETVAQRKTISVLRAALAKAEESSDDALKAKIAMLEKTVQSQKEAAEGGDLWSSLGAAASAVESLAQERADTRDRQSRVRAKAIISQAQFTALDIVGKASKQYDAMMTAGDAQVDVTNDTLHEGYIEYTKYIIGLNGVIEGTIKNLEDTLDTATRKLAEAVVAVKSLREVQKPLVKAAEDVFKPVELSGIKTSDKLPGMDDVLAFIASAPGQGISEDSLNEKDIESTLGKVGDTYAEMQIGIANAKLKAEESDKSGVKEVVEEEEASEVAPQPEDAPREVAVEAVEETVEAAEETVEAAEESASEPEDAPEDIKFTPQVEVKETEAEEVEPLIPTDETTVIPVVSAEEN